MFPVALVVLASLLQTSPEIELTTPVRNASPAGEFVTSAVAGSTTAMVTWTQIGGSRAVRFDRDGRRLDAAPIPLDAMVTRAGERWFAWSSDDGVIHGRFIREDGTSDSEPVELARCGPWCAPHVAADRTGFLSVWNTEFDDLVAVHTDTNGHASAPIHLGRTGGWNHSFDVVAFEEGFAIVWSAADDAIESMRLDGDGRVVSRTTLATPQKPVGRIRAFADGDTLVIAWVTDEPREVTLLREGGSPRVITTGVWFPEDFVKIGGVLYALLTSRGAAYTEVRLIAMDGSRDRTWDLGRTNVEVAYAASFGDRALVAVTTRADQATSHADLHTVVVGETLDEMRPWQRLEPDPAAQQKPEIARGANGESLAVWIEERNDNDIALVGVLLDAAGRPQGDLIRIASLRDTSLATVKIASDGVDYLVVWHDGRELRMQRVQRDGILVGSAVSNPKAHYSGSCVTWTGSEYVVGWVLPAQTHRFFFGSVRAMTIAPDGHITGDVAISDVRNGPGSLTCAAGTSSTLLAWAEVMGLRAAIRTHGGSISGLFPLGFGSSPAIAANGDSFAAAWSTFGGTGERAMVSAHGTVSPVDELPLRDLDQDTAGQKPVALAPFGSGYLLVWGSTDLYALALDANGRSNGQITISATGELEHNPAIAGGEVPVVLYTRGGPEWDRYSPPQSRAFTRTILSLPQPARRRSTRH